MGFIDKFMEFSERACMSTAKSMERNADKLAAKSTDGRTADDYRAQANQARKNAEASKARREANNRK